jgi:hypothetical protein
MMVEETKPPDTVSPAPKFRLRQVVKFEHHSWFFRIANMYYDRDSWFYHLENGEDRIGWWTPEDKLRELAPDEK